MCEYMAGVHNGAINCMPINCRPKIASHRLSVNGPLWHFKRRAVIMRHRVDDFKVLLNVNV